MRKYEIVLGRERVTLESHSAYACEMPRAWGKTAGVVISPSFSSDYYLCAIGEGGRITRVRPTHLFALGFYLHTVCGMPLAPLSLETPEGMIDTEFCSTGAGVIGIVLDECKQYVTSTSLADGVRTKVISARYMNSYYRLVCTKNPELVAESRLLELKVLCGLPDCRDTVAFSKSGCAVGGCMLDGFIAAAVTAPLCDGWERGRVCVKFNRTDFDVERMRGGRILVAPSVTEYTEL